jgi:hypothetical protein
MEEPIAFVWWLWYFLLHNVVSWALFRGKKKKSFVPFTTLLFSSPRCKKLPLKQLSYTQSFYLFLQGAIQLAHHKIILKIIPPKKVPPFGLPSIGYEDSSLGKNYGMKCSTIGNILRNTYGTWETCWDHHWELVEEHIGNMVRRPKCKKIKSHTNTPPWLGLYRRIDKEIMFFPSIIKVITSSLVKIRKQIKPCNITFHTLMFMFHVQNLFML